MRDRAVTGVAVLALAALIAGCETEQGEDPRTDPSTSASHPSMSSSVPPAITPTTTLTPAPQQFDHAAMQDAVHKVLTEYHRVEGLGKVICPPNRPVKKGTTFTCTASIDGTEKKVPIKVTTDDGDYKVGAPK